MLFISAQIAATPNHPLSGFQIREVPPDARVTNQAPVKSKSSPVIWVLGGPGSGKGTQCDKIVAKYGFTHLSTGDLLRAEVNSGSERGSALQKIMEKGDLVPNEIVLELLKEAIQTNAANSNGFLIDGYPREKEQGSLFEKLVSPVDLILYFDCSDNVLIERLLGRAATSGRADDNEETIKLRLNTFHQNNDLVIEQYPSKLKRINALGNVDEIFTEVQSYLDALIESKK